MNPAGRRLGQITLSSSAACSAPTSRPYLLVVLDAQADGVYQDGDHDASVEVFAFHDAPQLHPHFVPQPLASLPGTTSSVGPCAVLACPASLFTPGRPPLLVRFLHSSFLCLVFRRNPIGERGALGAAVSGRR